MDNKEYPINGGMWIVYLTSRRNLDFLIEKVKIFVLKYNIIGASIRIEPSNIIVIETTIDRFDIYKTKDQIQLFFKKMIREILWKAGFESKEDWRKDIFPKGDLWYIGELEKRIEETFKLIKQKRIAKAIRKNRDILKLSGEMRHAYLKKKIKNRKSMIVEPVFENISYKIKPKQVFLIMPFKEDWSNDTFKILSDTVSDCGLELIRADEIFSPGSIIQDIWKLINESGLIIADISVHNPNVFYELGISHTIGKKVLMIKKEGSSKSPFDIGFWRYFEYDTSYGKANEFKLALEKILSNYKNEYAI